MDRQGFNLEHPGLWQPRHQRASQSVRSTGWTQLDSMLPEGGWSRQCLYAITPSAEGEQELAMLLPSLRHNCTQEHQAARWVGLIAPPKIAWASRMAQAGIDPSRVMQVHNRAQDQWYPLWALEQALRTETCSLVFAWLPQLASHEWRRLQLLAKQSDTQVVIFQPGKQDTGAEASMVRYRHGQRPLRIELNALQAAPLH